MEPTSVLRIRRQISRSAPWTRLPSTVAANHSRWPRLLPSPAQRDGVRRNSFIGRYIFPEGDLIEVGAVISAKQEAGLAGRCRAASQ